MSRKELASDIYYSSSEKQKELLEFFRDMAANHLAKGEYGKAENAASCAASIERVMNERVANDRETRERQLLQMMKKLVPVHAELKSKYFQI